MTKQKLNNVNRLNANTVSADGLTIGELNPIQTALIKDTDLFAGETDLSTNSFSVGQIKEVVSNSILSKTNNQLGTILFHPAPAGYQNIPAETNGFGDAILVADGRQLDKTAYIDLWNFIKTRKDKAIYGFNGETAKSFKIDELTNKITLPNLLTGDALYMGNYGLQNAIFPQHTFTSGSIKPTTQAHQHDYADTYRQNGNGSDYQGDGAYQHRRIDQLRPTSIVQVVINPFTVSSSAISNLPAGITLGTDLKVAGVKMIPCIVCKPTYDINAGGGSGGGVATQDLDMNLFKIINVGMPVADSDAVRLVDLKVDNGKIAYRRNGVGGYDTLQYAIDDLYNLNEFYTGELNQINTNIETINSNIGSVNIAGLQTQTTTNTTDITNIKTVNTNQDSTIASLQSQVNSLLTKLNSFDTKYRNFTDKRVKSGLSVAINSNATNLTNLTQYILNSQTPTITSFGSSISGLPLGSIGLIDVGSGITQGFKFPTINGLVNCNLIFSTRITGAITGNVGTPRELIVYVRRVSDNSIVGNGALIKINDNNFNARNVVTPSYIQGPNDSFLTGGFYLNIFNNSGGNLTMNTIELLIQGS